MARAFPGLSRQERDRLAARGIDLELVLREWLLVLMPRRGGNAIERMIANGVHYGYEPWETPRYERCQVCGDAVRGDRLDLLAEHVAVCRTAA